jgi:hypothetical protein
MKSLIIEAIFGLFLCVIIPYPQTQIFEPPLGIVSLLFIYSRLFKFLKKPKSNQV